MYSDILNVRLIRLFYVGSGKYYLFKVVISGTVGMGSWVEMCSL
jgi:hypothetical protein